MILDIRFHHMKMIVWSKQFAFYYLYTKFCLTFEQIYNIFGEDESILLFLLLKMLWL